MDIVFAWDRSALLAILATLVFALIVTGRYAYLRGLEKHEAKKLYGRTPQAVSYREFGRVAFARNWAIMWVILFSFGSGASYIITSSSTPDREAVLNDAIAEYGLQNGTPYPLYLGGTQSSITGKGTAYASLFSASAVLDLKPTTVVNIGFEHKELWWPLTLPANKSPFKETSGDPSVTVWFYNQTLDMGSSAYLPSAYGEDSSLERSSYEAYWDVSWSECKMELHNLWLSCVRTNEGETLVVSEEWLNQSIPDFFDRYFDRAQIDLSPEQHDVLFPKS